MIDNENDAFDNDFDDEDFDIDLEGTGLLEEGVYGAVCEDVERGESKAGNPMFIWLFSLLDDRSETFKVYTAITPAALWKLAEVVEALGLGSGGGRVKFKKSQAVGTLCNLSIKHSQYQGVVRAQADKVLAHDPCGEKLEGFVPTSTPF
jgi:hypothetical protein